MAGKLPVHHVVVLGDGGTGKTALTIQFCLGHFPWEYDPTIEDVYKKETTIDREPCILEIIDTAGQEEYTALRERWIHIGQGFILMYSITSRSSFQRLLSIYNQIMRVSEASTDQVPPVYLVGNKCDRVTEREVSTQEGFALARDLKCSFLEVSSKNNVNVEDIFNGIVRQLRERQELMPKRLKSSDILKDAAVLSQGRSSVKTTSRISSFARRFRHTKSSETDLHKLDVTHQVTLNELLVKAVRENKRKTTSKLLALGAEPNGDTGEDGSSLYAAAGSGHTKMVTLLLDHQAAANARSKRGFTPLMIAAAEGHSTTVELLLARGALPNVHSDVHGTPLMAATFRCHTRVMELLLKNGADVNAKGGQYDTALHTSATVGNLKVAEILLNAGAHMHLRNRDQCTALQVAAAAGHAGLVRLFLLRGARALIDDTQGKYGSALKAANDNSRFDVMKVLLDLGADEKTMQIEPLITQGVPASDSSTGGGDLLHPPDQAAPLTVASLQQDVDASSPLGEIAAKHPILHKKALETTNPPDTPPLETSLEVVPHHDYSGAQAPPWDLISRLGQGSCSTVEEIRAKNTLEPRSSYARKVFLLTPRTRRRILPIIENEVNILKAVRHHHVSQIQSTYSTENEFAIIMTLADMNLGEYLHYNPRPTSDSPLYCWIGCLAAAFDYLHEQKIKHQDVKPTNILIQNGQVMVADFGISKEVLTDETTGSFGPSAKTLMYCAPEVAAADDGARRGRKADMFSLGCIFLEMVTTLLWPHGCSVPKLHEQIQVDEGRVYSASLDKVLRWILMLYALARTGIEEETQLSHTVALQWCLGMLLADADRRISARELRVAIDRYSRRRPPRTDISCAKRGWIGLCCISKEDDGQDVTASGIMHSWPALSLDAATLGYAAWDWDDIASRMTFRVPKSSA